MPKSRGPERMRSRRASVRIGPDNPHVPAMKAALRARDKEAFGRASYQAWAYEYGLPGQDEQPAYTSWRLGPITDLTFGG